MAAPPPPIALELAWQGDMRFAGRVDGVPVAVDGDRQTGPSPVQALATALAGCMAIDVLQVLTLGRRRLTGLTTHLTAERAAAEPRRLLRVDLRFVVAGEAPAHAVERAVALSRETYCSVWHSLRPDIELRTSFEVRPD
ncbi:MAG: OsmC family protein [Candidatus Rokuibacteriota bacterium]